jgi:hypothetical protein
VGPRAVLDAVVNRKIPSPRRETKPRTPIIQPVAQRYTTELPRFIYILEILNKNVACFLISNTNTSNMPYRRKTAFFSPTE